MLDASIPTTVIVDEAPATRSVSASVAAVLRVRAGLIAACVLAAALGSIGLTNEGSIPASGDPPRHIMNGVYLLDVLRDRPFSSPSTFLEHARLYYARYPALSLGHHPPLLAVAEVPMFAIFGVSIASAKLATLLAFVAATAFLYLVAADFYGGTVALLAAAFFVTSRYVLLLSRSVDSEVPALALLMAAAWFLRRFCTAERRRDLVGFGFAAVLGLYAKQLTAFVFPAFLLYAVATMGWKRLLKRDVLVAIAAIVILALPLVALTIVMSPANVTFAVDALLRKDVPGAHYMSVVQVIRRAMKPQLTVPILLLAMAGIGRAIVVKDRRSLLFAAWAVSVLVGVLTVAPYEPERYGIYWVPALCTLAASVVAGGGSGIRRLVFIALLALLAGYQALSAEPFHPAGAEGYEEAARFVVDSNPGPTVMFNGDVDTGLFSFFIRKHNPQRDLVVLLADKVLTTSLMGRVSVEDRIHSADEIYGILRTFGTRYIVTEDRPSKSRVLEWLRAELRSEKFVERRRIRIRTSDRALKDTDLVVYEYVDAVPPNPDAVLTLHVPLVKQSVSVPLSDLTSRKYLH
jgi:hypothetical protein